MIKLSEEGLSKRRQANTTPLVPKKNVKEKFLKEIKGVTPVNTQIIRRPNSLRVGLEKVVVVCTEDQIRHNIPLSQSLTWRKALTLINFMKAERGEEAAEGKFKAGRRWFMRLKKRSISKT